MYIKNGGIIMKNRKFVLAMGSLLCTSAVALSIALAVGHNPISKIKGDDEYYSIEIYPEDITTSNVRNSGVTTVYTHELGNPVDITHECAMKLSDGLYLEPKGSYTGTIYNDYGGGQNEIRSMTSIEIFGSGEARVYWGFATATEIEYIDNEVDYAIDGSGTMFYLNDDRPNYFKICSESTSQSLYISKIIIKYSTDCEAGENPYAEDNGLKFKRILNHYECLGFVDESVEDVVIPDLVNGYPVTRVADRAFYNDYTVETVTLGQHVSEVGELAFCAPYINTVNGIEQLRVIDDAAFQGTLISGALTLGANLQQLNGSPFYHCDNITAVVFSDECLPSYIADSSFNWCEGIQTIHIGSHMSNLPGFYGCWALQSFTVGEGNDYYAAVDGVLYRKSGESELQGQMLPYSLKTYAPNNTNITRIMYEFAEMSDVETVDLTNTSIRRIESEAFENCRSLNSITFPASLVYLDGYDIFKNCVALTDVDLRGTQVKEFAYGTFKGCESLASIELPATVETLGSNMFDGCGALASISFAGTTSQWNDVSKPSGWKGSIIATVVVCSDGSVAI